MKIRDLIFTYKNKLDELEKIADEYYNNHYCGYMGEWVSGSEDEYKKLKQDVQVWFSQTEIKIVSKY